MKGLIQLLALAALGAATPPSASADAVFGYWLTQNERAIVRVAACPQAADLVCGRIVWLSEPREENGALKTDRNNREAARRDDPLCSIELISGFRPAADGTWSGGSIYNPMDGQRYSATMAPMGDRLHLRGFVLLPVFGKSQTWTRVSGDRGGCPADGS